jgi:hypothetical protein
MASKRWLQVVRSVLCSVTYIQQLLDDAMFFERVVLPPLVDLGYFLKPYLAPSMRASLPTLLSTEFSPVPRHLTCMCFCNAASTKLHNSEFVSFQYEKFCNIFERGEYIKKYFKMSESLLMNSLSKITALRQMLSFSIVIHGIFQSGKLERQQLSPTIKFESLRNEKACGQHYIQTKLYFILSKIHYIDKK